LPRQYLLRQLAWVGRKNKEKIAMKLTRNTTEDGYGKYALIRLDKMRDCGVTIEQLFQQLGPLKKYIELGGIGSADEALVIKLKDINSPAAIGAYASSAFENDDAELSEDVFALLHRAGCHSLFRKKPD
jgi:hypothetical protein